MAGPQDGWLLATSAAARPDWPDAFCVPLDVPGLLLLPQAARRYLTVLATTAMSQAKDGSAPGLAPPSLACPMPAGVVCFGLAGWFWSEGLALLELCSTLPDRRRRHSNLNAGTHHRRHSSSSAHCTLHCSHTCRTAHSVRRPT